MLMQPGADFMSGEESKKEFAESMAPDIRGTGVMSPTIFFHGQKRRKKSGIRSSRMGVMISHLMKVYLSDIMIP